MIMKVLFCTLVGACLISQSVANYPVDVDCFNTDLCEDAGELELDGYEMNELEYENAAMFLKMFNCNGSRIYCEMVRAQFDFYMDETDETQNAFTAAQTTQAQFNAKAADMALNFTGSDASEQRQLDLIKMAIRLNETDSSERAGLINNMTSIFSHGVVCNYTVHETDKSMCDYATRNISDKMLWWPDDPTLTNHMAQSRDYKELQYIWEQWRINTGREMRSSFPEYVTLSNRGARAAGYADMGAFWRANYDTGNNTYDFEKVAEELWETVLPLYEELHAYVRTKLRKFYSKDISLKSTIPAHILGNMWGQQWNGILDLTKPYPNHTVDVTEEMIAQDYNATHMFEQTKKFFTSIGLPGYNDRFFNDSMIVRPPKKVVECYSDSEDFFNGKDFGMSTCTKVNMEDFITIHHEMGHINYFMEYAHQPALKFRDGANSGFHEAIGDTMALSATTTDHLSKIGLLPDYVKPGNKTTETDINFLFNMALQKIAFLPFGYLIDQYRWKVFDGSITQQNYQTEWWNMRSKYQGIYPPSEAWATNETYFDPGSKFHVAGDVPYIRYFVSFIIQFQFHKALCDKAGGPPDGFYHRCDIYDNKMAGATLKEVLQMGASEPWPVAMKKLTGMETMDASALVEYFQPLLDFLKRENLNNDECYGWGYDWKNVPGLNPNRCPEEFTPAGTAETFYLSFTDMGVDWQPEYADPNDQEHNELSHNYTRDFNELVNSTGYEKFYQFTFTVNQFDKVLKKASENSEQAYVGVHLATEIKTKAATTALPGPGDFRHLFVHAAKQAGYDFSDVQIFTTSTTSQPVTSTSTSPGTSTSSNTKPPTTTTSSGSGGSGKAKKLAIAALAISCIMVAAVAILIVLVIYYMRKGGNNYSRMGDTGSSNAYNLQYYN